MAIQVSIKNKHTQKAELVQRYFEEIAGYVSYPNGNGGYDDSAVKRFCKLFPETVEGVVSGDAYSVGHRTINPVKLSYRDVRLLTNIVNRGEHYHFRFNNFDDLVVAEAPLHYSINSVETREKYKVVVKHIDECITTLVAQIKAGLYTPDFNEKAHTSDVARLPLDAHGYTYDFRIFRDAKGNLSMAGTELTTPRGEKVYMRLECFAI